MNGSHFVEDTHAADAAQIELLLDKSFGIDRRIKTSYRLREGNNPVAGLSMVIRDNEVGISGAISFWPLKIGNRGIDALLLGPLRAGRGTAAATLRAARLLATALTGGCGVFAREDAKIRCGAEPDSQHDRHYQKFTHNSPSTSLIRST